MYKDELKEQIETLKLTQKICKTSASEVINISREILRLTREIERIEEIETKQKVDIDELTENMAKTAYEFIRRNKTAVM